MLLSRIVAVGGAFLMLAIAYALSTNRRKVSMKVVLWGVAMQWAFAVLFLWMPWGEALLDGVAAVVTSILEKSYEGSQFVFGDLGAKGGGQSSLGVVFAFQILPTIIFVAALFSILYHLGLMQKIVGALGWLMVRTMGTSGAESLSVGASVFMGQTEAPLTIRPFLARLTRSELFLVMVAGMATVSGAILGAYVAIGGVEMRLLLAAVAMSAPICVVTAKLMVPEDEVPETSGRTRIELPRDEQSNVLLAAATGTTDGLKLAVNVGAMLIVFIALVALVNSGLSLMSLGGEALTLERMLGWLFAPAAFAMGVPWADCPEVGNVLGTRAILNELIGFGQLQTVAAHIQPRSATIAVFAICGFASVSSIGIQIGGLGALAPDRKADIAKLGARALVAATLANFSTACVAGALLD